MRFDIPAIEEALELDPEPHIQNQSNTGQSGNKGSKGSKSAKQKGGRKRKQALKQRRGIAMCHSLEIMHQEHIVVSLVCLTAWGLALRSKGRHF